MLIFFMSMVMFFMCFGKIMFFCRSILSVLISFEFLILMLFVLFLFNYLLEGLMELIVFLVLVVGESILGLFLMLLKVFFSGNDLLGLGDSV